MSGYETTPLPLEASAAGAEAAVIAPTSKPKARPWRAVFPNPNPDPSQMQRYGFKKGEIIELAGNAGNFFAHDKWQIECESSASESK
jgi:hypothetical protein